MGVEKFLSLGLPKDGGPKLYGISGHVEKPGLYEAPMGTDLKTLIYDYAGGIRGGKALKAVIPGGLSTPVLRPDEIDIAMDFDSVRNAGSMLGSGGVIVMDEDTCLPEVLKRITEFYHHESCGQCTPCREGTSWLDRIMKKIVEGKGEISDIDLMIRVAKQIQGRTVCALGDAAAMPVIAFLTKYREDFESYIKNGGCN
jgi:NADH-quinone oxidoreductase subunit F